MESKYGIVEITKVPNFLDDDLTIENIEFFDSKEEAEQEADRRNKLIEKIIDKVLDNPADNSLCSRCYYKAIKVKEPKEFVVTDKVSFDINEGWETFNRRLAAIAKEYS